ncbi:hypothetical protein TUMSATVNIG1_29210 [Vibrio nigripulchritudo]|uniref:hypothetical protein n=1 Tax=Vibrio nigripulchritudo TaxID=28173 RepID=UPI00190DBF4A|nr:hypothetical protein [Vibrio nigripulchritudo]BCL70956.1 hypothetical protein VNTUMSATTG_28930 [Vibrio nigripulchritudo]BDU32312.1 hypothetical protein TUMSATVNIG1_29210 [Vibrio nigripulchritudo]
MKNLLLLSAVLGSWSAFAQNPVYQLHPDSVPVGHTETAINDKTRLVEGTRILNTQTQETITVTGKLLILVKDESELRQIAHDFGLLLSSYTPGSKLGVFTAPKQVDLNELQARLTRDERVRKVRIETDEKRFIAY